MRKVYELLDKTRSLLSFAGRASLYSGVVAGGDSPISVAYFGNGANLQFLIGAIFGGLSWLFVGLYLSRRANERQARNAARAVYFELAMNEIDIDVAPRLSHHAP